MLCAHCAEKKVQGEELLEYLNMLFTENKKSNICHECGCTLAPRYQLNVHTLVAHDVESILQSCWNFLHEENHPYSFCSHDVWLFKSHSKRLGLCGSAYSSGKIDLYYETIRNFVGDIFDSFGKGVAEVFFHELAHQDGMSLDYMANEKLEESRSHRIAHELTKQWVIWCTKKNYLEVMA